MSLGGIQAFRLLRGASDGEAPLGRCGSPPPVSDRDRRGSASGGAEEGRESGDGALSLSLTRDERAERLHLIKI